MTDLFTKCITIYNDMPGIDSKPRSFDRHIIKKCLISDSRIEKSQGTVTQESVSKQIITKDTERYLSPEMYKMHPSNEINTFYTVQTGDFIILDEVTDVVNTAQDFVELQKKYKNIGFKVTSVETFINGLETDNITIRNA